MRVVVSSCRLIPQLCWKTLPTQRFMNKLIALKLILNFRPQSPWAQFFQDNELRKVIMQDIKRTYPGELMFEQKEIRDIMLNILFIYAREQPDISYKQVKGLILLFIWKSSQLYLGGTSTCSCLYWKMLLYLLWTVDTMT